MTKAGPGQFPVRTFPALPIANTDGITLAPLAPPSNTDEIVLPPEDRAKGAILLSAPAQTYDSPQIAI